MSTIKNQRHISEPALDTTIIIHAHTYTHLSKAAFSKNRDKFEVAGAKFRQILRSVGFMLLFPQLFEVHVLRQFAFGVYTVRRLLQHATLQAVN